MLDFCAKHGVAADVEVIPIDKINEAYEVHDQGRCALSLRHRHRKLEIASLK